MVDSKKVEAVKEPKTGDVGNPLYGILAPVDLVDRMIATAKDKEWVTLGEIREELLRR